MRFRRSFFYQGFDSFVSGSEEDKIKIIQIWYEEYLFIVDLFSYYDIINQHIYISTVILSSS